jgi:hypothetical protein
VISSQDFGYPLLLLTTLSAFYYLFGTLVILLMNAQKRSVGFHQATQKARVMARINGNNVLVIKNFMAAG